MRDERSFGLSENEEDPLMMTPFTGFVPIFSVSDLAASRDFYVEHLSFGLISFLGSLRSIWVW
jgi:hypothetical protein